MPKVLLPLVLLAVACASAPPPLPDPVAVEIAKMDAEVSAAFNAHDLGRLMALFSEDLEFYHDAGGVQSYAQVSAGFQDLFAKNNGIRRDFVGTMRVYPIPNHGAMQIGAHRFCHVENGKNDCGTFEFSTVWRQRDGKWQMTRVLSYGH